MSIVLANGLLRGNGTAAFQHISGRTMCIVVADGSVWRNGMDAFRRISGRNVTFSSDPASSVRTATVILTVGGHSRL